MKFSDFTDIITGRRCCDPLPTIDCALIPCVGLAARAAEGAVCTVNHTHAQRIVLAFGIFFLAIVAIQVEAKVAQGKRAACPLCTEMEKRLILLKIERADRAIKVNILLAQSPGVFTVRVTDRVKFATRLDQRNGDLSRRRGIFDDQFGWETPFHTVKGTTGRKVSTVDQQPVILIAQWLVEPIFHQRQQIRTDADCALPW